MYLTSLKTVVYLPAEGLRLFSPAALPLLLDCHHGETYVLKVTGLERASYFGPPPPETMLLEVNLTPYEKVLTLIEIFAAHHQLNLEIRLETNQGLEEALTLAACHIPQDKLFIYSEKARLAAQATPEGNVLLKVHGDFQKRLIPSQETDLMLHLQKPGAGRLLSYLFQVVRERI